MGSSPAQPLSWLGQSWPVRSAYAFSQESLSHKPLRQHCNLNLAGRLQRQDRPLEKGAEKCTAKVARRSRARRGADKFCAASQIVKKRSHDLPCSPDLVGGRHGNPPAQPPLLLDQDDGPFLKNSSFSQSLKAPSGSASLRDIFTS